MTEPRAAYEAATIEAMHTGDYAALTAYACTVADVDDAPDLEYTPITAPLPAVADAAEVAELRGRIAELESERRTVRGLLTAFLHSDDTSAVRALDRWLTSNTVQP